MLTLFLRRRDVELIDGEEELLAHVEAAREVRVQGGSRLRTQPHDAAADRGVHPHTPSDIPGVLLMMVVVLLRLAFSLHAASSASSINFRHRLIALMRARTLSRVKPSTASDWLGSIT